MTLKATDYSGILTLDRQLVVQLRTFLDEKEVRLADRLLHLFPLEPDDIILPAAGHLRLSQAVEMIGRRVRGMHDAPDNWKLIVQELNRLFWNYVETLESNVTEFFQQLDQVNFESWTPHLYESVEGIKELLVHRIEDFIWTIRRTEKIMLAYKALCQGRKNLWIVLGRLWSQFSTLLDEGLFSNLSKSEELLVSRFKLFKSRYVSYKGMYDKTNENLEKFKDFFGFQRMDDDEQERFKQIYRLTKMWEENRKADLLPGQEISRTLKHLVPVGKAQLLFKNYIEEMKKALFSFCRMLQSDIEVHPETFLPLMKSELRSLGATIARYRDFLLRTDPNPYVRSRLGFSEWVVGPEPRKTKDLLNMMYDVEKVESLVKEVEQRLKLKSDEKVFYSLKRDIEVLLHEMGQPLSSRAMIRTRAEQLLNKLDACDELASTYGDISPFMEKTFIKALRCDWKYQVLNEFPLFHKLYMIHMGLTKMLEPKFHLNRLNKFKQIIHHLEVWVSQRDTLKHVHDIEHDLSDVRELLQDFLAEVQRGSDPMHRQQLLEYRYLFANFFHFLRQQDAEGKLIRNQFIFVDQYLEAAER